jgi:hypothetical protein
MDEAPPQNFQELFPILLKAVRGLYRARKPLLLAIGNVESLEGTSWRR